MARAGLVLVALVFLQQSLQLGLWLDGMPGPGLLPFLAAIGLLLLMVPILLGHDVGGVFDLGDEVVDEGGRDDGVERREATVDAEAAESGPAVAPGRPLEALAWLGGYALILESAGFIAASLLLFAGWGVRMHARRWSAAVAVALVLVGLGTLVFHTLLGVPMPLWPGADR